MTCHLYFLKPLFFWRPNKMFETKSSLEIVWAYLLAWFLILHHSFYSHLSSFEKHLHQPLDQETMRGETKKQRVLFYFNCGLCTTTISTQKGTRPPLPESGNFSSPWVLCSPLFFCYYIFMCLYPAKILHTLHPSFSTNFCWTLAFLETRFL